MGHFAVKRATAIRLLESGETASRKAQTENQIRIVLFEMAGAAINGLAVTPEGLYTLLKVSFFGRTEIEADGPPSTSLPTPSLDLLLIHK